MSLYHFGQVWRHSPARGVARLVHLALADAADSEGRVGMSHTKIASVTNADSNAVSRAIEALIGFGTLQIAESKKGNRSAIYELCGHGNDEKLPVAENPAPLNAEMAASATPVPLQIATAPTPMSAKPMPEVDLHAILAALGVGADPMMPLYWYRQEHKADLNAVCERLGMALAELLVFIQQKSIATPGLREMRDLEPITRGCMYKSPPIPLARRDNPA